MGKEGQKPVIGDLRAKPDPEKTMIGRVWFYGDINRALVDPTFIDQCEVELEVPKLCERPEDAFGFAMTCILKFAQQTLAPPPDEGEEEEVDPPRIIIPN